MSLSKAQLTLLSDALRAPVPADVLYEHAKTLLQDGVDPRDLYRAISALRVAAEDEEDVLGVLDALVGWVGRPDAALLSLDYWRDRFRQEVGRDPLPGEEYLP